MQLQEISWKRYQLPMRIGNGATLREGIYLSIRDEKGRSSEGEVAPLPHWSQETLEQALEQLDRKQTDILAIDWKEGSWAEEISGLKLYPSVSFGLESAVLSLLLPLSPLRVAESALLMGTPKDILDQASARHREGYVSAKLKVGNLSFKDAKAVIDHLKDTFQLRIDVNRAWQTQESLHFFSQYPLDAFDYVEEPFRNPLDLALFSHPLAVDESFPKNISLEFLDTLPVLKALIYKPTIQGGLISCLSLYQWTQSRGISLVMSSSFESDLGLSHIAAMARRLSLTAPAGLGTRHFILNE